MSIGRVPIRRLSSVFLGKMIQPEPRSGADVSTPYLRAAHIQPGGRLVEVDPKEMWFDPHELRRHDLRVGDVVVVEGGAGYGRSAFISADRPGWGFQNSILRLRPFDGEATGRLINYALIVALEAGEVAAEVSTATIPHFTAEKVGSFEVPMAPRGDRLRIANYLDDQVARIDEIIRLRRKQSDALGDRFSTAMDESLIGRGWQQPATLEVEGRQLLPHGWRVATLSQVLRQLTNGYVGPTRDVLVHQGLRYVQSLHIKGGRIDFDRRHFFVTPEWHAARPRIHLREGDVLIVQTGDIGKVAVVPPDFGEASCHALQIARVRPEIVSGPYLGGYLGSSFGYHALLSRATGALHPHLEGGIRSIPVVIPPLAVQAEIVSEVERTQGHIALLQAEMQSQVDLLQERKRSLITAAVTGEFDVSTASGRGVA